MSAFLEMHRYLATLETSTAQQRGESKVMVEDPDATSSFAPVVPVPSDDEQQPRSKLRRRWRMQSTTAPVAPPLPTTSPSSSGASSSAWQLVSTEGFKEGVPAFDIGNITVDSTCPLLASGSLPPRPNLRISRGDPLGRLLRCACATILPFS